MRRIALIVASIGAALGVALFVYALLIEPRRTEVRFMTIGSGELNIRIALVTDIHIGGLHVGPDRVREIAELINAQNVDMTLLPGDFIGGHTSRGELSDAKRAEIDEGLLALRDIEFRLIATLGNHDNWHGAEDVRRGLDRAGFVVLENEGHRFSNICVVGFADSDTAAPNANGYDDCEAGDRIIALMHSPDARGLLRSDVALAVAGHTHGGQINLPFLGRAVTATQCGKPCAYGLIQTDPPLIVSSGIGTSILPIRFRSPPEIVIIDLLKEPA